MNEKKGTNEHKRLRELVGRLKRNETRMTPEQKIEYAAELTKLKKLITSLALKSGRDFLFSGILLGDDGKYVTEQIRAGLGANEIADTERAALTVLFECYDCQKFFDTLLPLALKIYYLGYGQYWVRHCKPVKDADDLSEFSYYNSLINMFWVEEEKSWKTKGKREWAEMLPPTMDAIRETYQNHLAELKGEEK